MKAVNRWMAPRINHDKLRTVEQVKVEALNAMHTGSLLSRLAALRALHESFSRSDWSEEEREAVEEAGLIAFKDTEIWRVAWTQVKQALKTREHFPRGSRERRRTIQQEKQSR